MRTKLKKKSKNRKKVCGERLNGRSRISNGSQLLPDVDGRSTYARRVRDLIRVHTDDLGGSNAISQAQLSLIRRASVLTGEIELMEGKFARQNGATRFQLERYQRTVNTLRRLLESMGLEKRARPMKNITPISSTADDDIDFTDYELTLEEGHAKTFVMDDGKVFVVLNPDTDEEVIVRRPEMEHNREFVRSLRKRQNAQEVEVEEL